MELATLLAGLAEAERSNQNRVNMIKDQIQTHLNARFDDWKALQEGIKAATECDGVAYQSNEYGEAEAWLRCDALSDVAEVEREYLENYVAEHCIHINWEHDCLSVSLGGDEILINDSGRKHDRGVYQSGKQIIEESDYTDENEEVDETKRNILIERHMEATGCFPGVFRTSEHDNELYPVKTTI